jgi:hypothetical protein
MFPIISSAALSLLATAPATTVAPVTVQAAPATPKQVLQRSRTFVETHAASTAKIDQLARWRDPLCVSVDGLVPEQATAVKARIEDVAKAVGLKLQRPGCKANIEVVFTSKPQNLLDWVASRDNAVLGFHYPSQTNALKTVTRPVQAWYMTATLGGSSDNASLAFMNIGSVGATGAVSGSIGLPGSNRPPESVDMPGNGTPNSCGGRKFTSCLSSEFKNVLVVVDARHMQGQGLIPLTDYVAMLALSQPKSLDGCESLASVIDLYAPAPCPGRGGPDGFTPADAAYLTALYAMDPQLRRTEEQSEIAERMSKMLVKAGQ